MASSVEEIMRAVNQACRSRGGKYAGYTCQTVSWDDVSRQSDGGVLSCAGANITDTYLKSKDGTQLFTVRHNNWNEKLGCVSASDVAFVTGNHVPGGGPLSPITLRDYLKSVGKYGAYAGLADESDLSDEMLDAKCSIRFQSTFIPMSASCGALEFSTEARSYNTHSNDDPRNLLLLCTSQGVAVQQNLAGWQPNRILHHTVDADSGVHCHWLEAERTQHRVGGPQRETAEERADALMRGKATASTIGTRSMGARFNVLMTIQIPLQQKQEAMHPPSCSSAPLTNATWDANSFASGDWYFEPDDITYQKMFECSDVGPGTTPEEDDDASDFWGMNLYPDGGDFYREADNVTRGLALPCSDFTMSCGGGISNAARVSLGSEFGIWSEQCVAMPRRDATQHVTITVVIYNTITDGVPSVEDVSAAIDDLENLYAQCDAKGHLAEKTFNFMKSGA